MDEYGESPLYDDDDFSEMGTGEEHRGEARPDVIKVSAKSRSTAVAGAIAGPV
jgi:hypothetical protein